MCVDPSEEAFLSMKGDARADAGGAAERNVAAAAVMRIKSARSGVSASSSSVAGGGSGGGSSAGRSGGGSQANGAVPASNSVHWDRSRIREELGRLDPRGMLLRVPDAGLLSLCSSLSYSCGFMYDISSMNSQVEEHASLSYCQVAAAISRNAMQCSARCGAERTEGAYVQHAQVQTLALTRARA